MNKWTRAFYLPALPLYDGLPRVTASNEHRRLSRRAAAQGAVLLKNDGLLPVNEPRYVALFGRGTHRYIQGGGGSGEVFVTHTTNIYEGFLEKEKEGKVKLCHALAGFYMENLQNNPDSEEPAIPAELISAAKEKNALAVITISRFSGEAWDRKATKGDFYLTDEEQALVDTVCENFADVCVVLNIGGMIDTAFIKDNPKIKAALLAWQGGIEGGAAVADLLCGDETPSGKLCDTFAREFADYPSAEHFNDSDDYLKYYEDIYVGYRYFETIPSAHDKVCYPFGFGLSYTEFDISNIKTFVGDGDIYISATVTNTGKYSGREVLQVYYSAPQGVLGKPKYELAAFKKTRKLNPNESEWLTMSFPITSMASYDDEGKLQKSAYLLENGDYKVFVGTSVRDLTDTGFVYTVEEPFRVTEQLTECCTPSRLEKRMLADGSFVDAPHREVIRYHDSQPEFTYKPTEEPFKLIDVYEGRCSLDDFICQMTDDELIMMTGGQENRGVSNTLGMGGIERLGIPEILTADGPAGVRINPECACPTTCWPCATLIACTWDPEIAAEIAEGGAKEIVENNLGIWLTPAINIHRNPLCGRNFEYLSEDPLLSGKIAASEVRAMQKLGVACSVKHFACNNKETNRQACDSIVTERALREIYIKAFEIVVKESDPYTVMTAYNLINGCHASENYELITTILRKEWGYRGMVTTDWSNWANPVNELLAGNDIKMPLRDNDVIKNALENGELTRGDIAVCVKRILEMMLKVN